MARPVEDMTGRKCGVLRVTARGGVDSGGRATWVCLCECGRTVVLRGDNLRRGAVKSCGQCGAFHPQGLTSSNAVWLLHAYTADSNDTGIHAFTTAVNRETGELGYVPRIPTYIRSLVGSAMAQLALAGRVRAKENRSSVTRWATEERCVAVAPQQFSSGLELDELWRQITGLPLNEPDPNRKVFVPVVTEYEPLPPHIQENWNALLDSWTKED